MTDNQNKTIMQALARLAKESAQLKELMLDAIADVGDLKARIADVSMRLDE